MFATALALVTFAAAPVPKGAEKHPKHLIQGAWKIVRFESGGKPLTVAADQPQRVSFAGDKIELAHGDSCSHGTFALGATTDPVHIDLALADQPRPCRESGPDHQFAGLLKFEGDELHIYLMDAAERPKAFPQPGAAPLRSALLVLVREKKK